MLKYPIPKNRRIKLAKIFFHVATTPGMSTQTVATCADAFKTLTRSNKKLTVEDMRLSWRPIYDILHQDLFLTRRQFEYTYVERPIRIAPPLIRICCSQLSWCMGYLAESARKFFHPGEIGEMLETFVPLIDGTKLNVSSFLLLLRSCIPIKNRISSLPSSIFWHFCLSVILKLISQCSLVCGNPSIRTCLTNECCISCPNWQCFMSIPKLAIPNESIIFQMMPLLLANDGLHGFKKLLRLTPTLGRVFSRTSVSLRNMSGSCSCVNVLLRWVSASSLLYGFEY